MKKSKEKTFVVYKHTSPSGKSYIGITYNYAKRCKEHQKKYSGCRLFKNAINYYGWNKFTHEILASGLTLQSANHFEEFYIKRFGTVVPNGYNLASGGGVFAHCEESKKRMSDAIKGENHPFFGKFGSDHPSYGMKHTPESKAKMSESRKGENNHNFGKVGADSYNSKTYLVINPYGKYEIITGLVQYCEDNGLFCSAMSAVAKCKQPHHKKYHCEYIYTGQYTEDDIKEKSIKWVIDMENYDRYKTGSEHHSSKTYKITKPNGDVIFIKGLVVFCKENGLTYQNMRSVMYGRRKHHKGYKCEHYTEEKELEEAA
jgi:group I intron endonuclease